MAKKKFTIRSRDKKNPGVITVFLQPMKNSPSQSYVQLIYELFICCFESLKQCVCCCYFHQRRLFSFALDLAAITMIILDFFVSVDPAGRCSKCMYHIDDFRYYFSTYSACRAKLKMLRTLIIFASRPSWVFECWCGVWNCNFPLAVCHWMANGPVLNERKFLYEIHALYCGS